MHASGWLLCRNDSLECGPDWVPHWVLDLDVTDRSDAHGDNDSEYSYTYEYSEHGATLAASPGTVHKVVKRPALGKKSTLAEEEPVVRRGSIAQDLPSRESRGTPGDTRRVRKVRSSAKQARSRSRRRG